MGYISDFSKNQSTGGYYSFTKKNNQLGVDELLAAAQAQGGAVGEVAYELTHPKSSILSTIGTGFKKAFAGFVDIIGTPLNVVAGAISQEKTISEAMEENLTVSEVLFKERDKRIPQTKLEKVGGFILRTAVDILADPLTYITFGASRGIFGLKSLPSLKITEKTFNAASGIIAKTDKELADLLFKQTGKELSETALKAEIEATRKGASEILRKSKVDDMGQFIGGTMNVSEKGQKMMETYIANKRQGLMNSVTAKEVRETLEANLTKSGVKLSNDVINKRVLDAMNGLDKVLLSQTADARLSKEFVQETVSNMLGARPALIETWIDKGGIKAFGKTILSGQRIAAIKPYIPGLTMLDEATKGARNVFKAAFSNNYSIHGEKPAGLVSLTQRAKDIVTSTQNSAMEDLIRAGKKFKLDENEMDMIVSALEGGQMPSDPKLAEFWKATQGMDFDKNIVRDEVFQGTRFFQQLRKKNLRMMREAGIPITERQNYFGHILVDNKVKNIPFKPGINKAPSASKFAQVSAFVDKQGDRMVAFAKQVTKGDETKLELFTKNADGVLSKTDELIRQQEEEFLSTVSGQMMTRARATIKEAGELGFEFESNPYKVMAIKTIEAIKSSASNEFVRDVAKKYGKLASEAGEGFVTVKGIKDLDGRFTELQQFLKGTNGEDIMFHPAVAKEIENFMSGVVNDEATDKIMRAFDKVQSYWKSSVTSIFPSFHGRNAISNVFLHYLDLGVHSLNPANHIRSAKMMFDNHRFSKLQGLISTGKATAKDMDSMYELMNKVVMTDNTGMPWTFGELRSIIQKNVVGFNPNLVGQLDMSQSSREMVEDMVENLFPGGIKDTIKQKANPFKWGRNVGNIVEDQARILSFLTNLEKTGDPIHAAQRTKMFLFDYANLTKFEKGIMRRIIPFYSFTRKNLELQAKTLFSTPGRISAEINAVSSIGDILSNDKLTDEEKSMLPEWLNNGLVTLKSRNGNVVEVLGQLGTPIEAAFGSIQPSGLLSSVSPLIKVPVELASGYSFFHGKALSEVTNAAAFKDAPQVVKDFVGFTEVKGKRKDGSEYEYYVSLRPERMHLVLSLPPTARVFSSLKQMAATDVSQQSKILQQLIGVRPFSFDLEVEAARREKELQTKLENILDDANVGYTFSRFSLTKEPKTFK